MNNVYLITGASSEIGINLIKNIYNDNDIFIAHYNNNDDKLKELREKLGTNIKLYKANFFDEEDLDLFINNIKQEYEKITHIIHLSAPNIKYEKFQKVKWSEFQNELNIQLRSIVKITNAIIGSMAKRKNGKILFLLTSGVIDVPPKYLTSYITAKYALLGFMKALAAEYAEKHICINGIAPSMINTAFLKDVPDIVIQTSEKNNPMKRNATTDDIIPVMKMLLSNENKFITGNCISITGGEIF